MSDTTPPIRKGYTLIEQGYRKCLTCGEAHHCWREDGSPLYGSWAHPDDGHAYRTTNRDALAERAFREILAVLGTGKCSVNTCEGCEAETAEAIRIAEEALRGY